MKFLKEIQSLKIKLPKKEGIAFKEASTVPMPNEDVWVVVLLSEAGFDIVEWGSDEWCVNDTVEAVLCCKGRPVVWGV